MISGKPVTLDTSLTLKPAARSAFAVPPVEINATPSAANRAQVQQGRFYPIR